MRPSPGAGSGGPGPGRYERQVRVAQLGPGGQARLGRRSVVVVGCGALGSMAAQAMVRAGVGRVRVVDRDRVELGNLHRQVLYDEGDVGRPKAEVAAVRLARMNAGVRVEGVVTDVAAGVNGPGAWRDLLRGADLVLDGLDAFEARYAVNDACLDLGVPWIHAGVLGTAGTLLVIRPGRGPCLRCLVPEPPEPGDAPTPEAHGVLGPLPMVMGALQATAALRLLSGAPATEGVTYVDVWEPALRTFPLARDPGCPACARAGR